LLWCQIEVINPFNFALSLGASGATYDLVEVGIGFE
jgi:hypothetical protein